MPLRVSSVPVTSCSRVSRSDSSTRLGWEYEWFPIIDYLLQLPETYTKQLSEEIRPMIRKEAELMELYNKENASPTIMNAFDLELEKGIEQGIGLEKKKSPRR